MEDTTPHKNDFDGRAILVTGAGSGIGRSIASLLSRRGATVIALDCNATALDSVKGLPNIRVLVADLGDATSIGDAVASACAEVEILNGVVNCAAVTDASSFEALPLGEWQRALAVNLTGPALLLQAALPFLRRAAGKASIVNIASAQALLPAAQGGTAYTASKAALIGLTKALAAELAPDVRVNVVCPGLTDTEMGRNAMGPNGFEAASQRYLLKRAAQPSEIAECVLFLLSDASSIVTGATWATDCGRSFH